MKTATALRPCHPAVSSDHTGARSPAGVCRLACEPFDPGGLTGSEVDYEQKGEGRGGEVVGGELDSWLTA